MAPLRARLPTRVFDVICAGEARWSLRAPEARSAREPRASMGLGASAVTAALELASRGLRTGLVTALDDDTFGRTVLERLAAGTVDTAGVVLEPPGQGLVFVEGAGASRDVLPFRETESRLVVPEGWASRVLLLSGVTPVVSYAASLCKAARHARREGTVVVLALNARRHAWAGRDPRATSMLLREADVVRCSADDLAALGMGVEAVRSALRSDAVLVATNRAGDAWAAGPFGEVARPRPKGSPWAPGPEAGGVDALAVSVCEELARAGQGGRSGPGRPDLWDRALACSSLPVSLVSRG